MTRPNIPLSLVLVLFGAAVIGSVWWVSDRQTDSEKTQASRTATMLKEAAFEAAVQQRDSSVAGCNRTRADREDAIIGWSQARKARRATASNPDVSTRERLTAAAAAAVYAEVIKSYRSRVVDCADAFPPPRPPR